MQIRPPRQNPLTRSLARNRCGGQAESAAKKGARWQGRQRVLAETMERQYGHAAGATQLPHGRKLFGNAALSAPQGTLV